LADDVLPPEPGDLKGLAFFGASPEPQSEITNRQGHPALALGTRNAKTRRAHWGKQTELRKAP
jgi:hypothetical protein